MSIFPENNPLEGIRVITFDIDNTLSYLDDVVQRANLYLFDYIKVHYPKIILQSPNEIGNTLMEILNNNNGKCENIGELRKKIILGYVQKAGYEDSVAIELFDTWRNERKKTTLIPYAKELIELLHSKGFILGIMTNGTASMEYHKSLNALFAVLVNPENCGGSKPDLAPFTKMMELVDIHDPTQFMHVGDDYTTDVIGANNAGWKSVLITNGYPYTISSNYPTIQVTTMKDLYYYFSKLLKDL